MMSKPSPRAIASTVAESRPPLRSTTAVRVTDARSLHGGAVAGHHLLRHPSRENLRSLWHHVGRDPLELVRVVEHQLAGRYVYELTAEYPDQVAGLADLAHHHPLRAELLADASRASHDDVARFALRRRFRSWSRRRSSHRDRI